MSFHRSLEAEPAHFPVLRSEIRERTLPTRPTKMTGAPAKGFGDMSVELNAIEPACLRLLVESALTLHLQPHELHVLLVAEEEKRLLHGLVGMVEEYLKWAR